jgi:hypothetical protein
MNQYETSERKENGEREREKIERMCVYVFFSSSSCLFYISVQYCKRSELVENNV